MNKLTGYISVSFHLFLTFYFFSLRNCWNVNCDIWSLYAGDRFDTIPPVGHPNNTIIVLLFICRISRSLCRSDDILFQSDGLKQNKKKYQISMRTEISLLSLSRRNIYPGYQFSLFRWSTFWCIHSLSCVLHHLRRLIQIWCWCSLPIQYQLIIDHCQV